MSDIILSMSPLLLGSAVLPVCRHNIILNYVAIARSVHTFFHIVLPELFIGYVE